MRVALQVPESLHGGASIWVKRGPISYNVAFSVNRVAHLNTHELVYHLWGSGHETDPQRPRSCPDMAVLTFLAQKLMTKVRFARQETWLRNRVAAVEKERQTGERRVRA